jgi:hypothetical protein
VHKSLNLLFVAVLAGHIGAALKHHFIDQGRHPDPHAARLHSNGEMNMKRIASPRAGAACPSAHAVEYTRSSRQERHHLRLQADGRAVDGKFRSFPAS